MKRTREERIKQHKAAKEKVAKLWGQTIPGLELNDIEYQKIKDAFKNWSTYFQRNLFEKGLDGLIARYKSVVHNVMTQTCCHRKDYFSCCGISYEYLNDISIREAFYIIMKSVLKL